MWEMCECGWIYSCATDKIWNSKRVYNSDEDIKLMSLSTQSNGDEGSHLNENNDQQLGTIMIIITKDSAIHFKSTKLLIFILFRKKKNVSSHAND